MIEFKVNELALHEIENRLGIMEDEARDILKKSINQTAKQARTRITKQVQVTYAAKQGRFNKQMRIENAKKNNLIATISTEGKMTELMDYKTSPAKVPSFNSRPSITKGKVFKKSSMKELKKDEVKAFVVRFKSGHVSVVERVPGKKMKSNKNKEFLRKLLSPSVAHMAGNEKEVYGKIEPYIFNDLWDNIYSNIRKTWR